jgi:hypothetical protein
MLRSLMVQLLEQDLFLRQRVIPHFRKNKIRHEQYDWEAGELKEFLREYATHQDKDTLILIDALDECNDSDVKELADFLENLSENAVRSDSNLSICLSSRYYPHIDIEKKIELVVEHQPEHDDDIFKYVQSKLKAKDKGIHREILEKAQHIFIWVVLVVEMLNIEFNKGKIKAMLKKLNEIPSNIDKLFSQLLEKEDSEDDKKTTILLFQWLLFSVRPMKPTEIYFAVLAGTDPDYLGAWDPFQVDFETIRRFITSASRGLVEIVSETSMKTTSVDQGIVQFIHKSVIDFLTRNQRLVKLDPTLAPNSMGASHARLASCCMAYIMQRELGSLAVDISSRTSSNEEFLDEMKKSYPLIKYTLENLLKHTENAQAEGISQISLLRRLEKHGEAFHLLHNRWFQLDESFKGAPVIYVASLKGCYYLVQALLLEYKSNVNSEGGYLGTALHAAAAKGFPDTVALLLDHGADINTQGGRYGSVLQAAVAEGSTDTIMLLLNHGADVNAPAGYLGTALQGAAAQGSKDIVALLLRHGADVNAQGGNYSTALQAAVAQRSTDIAALLLDHGANVNALGGYYSTALQEAAAQGFTDIVALLLDHGAEVNTQSGSYGTALQEAVAQGFTELAALLLDRGATPS